MRKLFAFLLIAAILVAMAVPAWAASASLSGPGVVRAGDTIKLSFRAGGDQVRGGSGKWSFDESQLTLVSFDSGLSGDWKAEYNVGQKTFFFYHEQGSSGPALGGAKTILTATFKVKQTLTPGTNISVSVSYSLSDGKTDVASSGDSYSATIAEPLSDNANLASLTVSNANISPSFSPDVTDYTAYVPFSTGSLKVDAQAEHGGAKVSVSGTALTANATTNVKVTVTAENGATKVYTIRTFRAQDPNYVPSNVNTLKALSVEGFPLSPAFSADKTEYAVYVPFETESVKLAAEKSHSLAKVKLPDTAAVPVGQSRYEILVTAEDGQTRSYFVTVFRAEEFGVEEPTQPEETQPETEPSTEPTEPSVEPTQPIEPEDPQIPEPQFPWIPVILAAVAGLVIGAAGAGLILKKKEED